jgi:hypothetical protein
MLIKVAHLQPGGISIIHIFSDLVNEQISYSNAKDITDDKKLNLRVIIPLKQKVEYLL